MNFYIPGPPISKARHRSFIKGKRISSYDPQSTVKDNIRKIMTLEMREKGLKMLQDQPLHVEVTVGTACPKKLARDAENASSSFYPIYSTKRPDIDNYLKFYFDAMNQVAFHDDNLIASVYAKKVYAIQPYVNINITPIGGNMVNEHAKTIQGTASMADINYIVKKANKLGKSGRDVTRVFSQEDDEGTHIYFETEPLQKINFSSNNEVC